MSQQAVSTESQVARRIWPLKFSLSIANNVKEKWEITTRFSFGAFGMFFSFWRTMWVSSGVMVNNTCKIQSWWSDWVTLVDNSGNYVKSDDSSFYFSKTIKRKNENITRSLNLARKMASLVRASSSLMHSRGSSPSSLRHKYDKTLTKIFPGHKQIFWTNKKR